MERQNAWVWGILAFAGIIVVMWWVGQGDPADTRSAHDRFEEDYAFPLMERVVNIYQSWGTPSSEEVVQAFEDEGLEVGASYPVEEEPDFSSSLTPKVYKEGTRFEIPSLGPDNGGRVFVFDNQEDLQVMEDYYEGINRMGLFGGTWIYEDGLVLVQINSELPASRALQYERVLHTVV